ncbi:MAG: hypothetical protein WBE13_11235, partial [Candidatus Acidiferrum sp.]
MSGLSKILAPPRGPRRGPKSRAFFLASLTALLVLSSSARPAQAQERREREANSVYAARRA